MDLFSDDHAAKRRKVRKGTHSCWECRRRKVKCLFSSPDDSICINCSRRGTSCIEQSFEITSEAISNHAPPDGYEIGGGSSASASSKTSPAPSGLMSIYMSQGQNDPQGSVSKPLATQATVLPPTPASSVADVVDNSHLQKLRHILLKAIPSSSDIKILMDKMRQISMLAYESYYKNWRLSDAEREKAPSPKTLLYPEAHPVLLARQMLLFAAAMRYLAPNEHIPGLSKHHLHIIEDLVEATTQAVSRNDALVGSLEHLQTIVLEAFCHIDSGNIRRAWMTIHRAVMVSKLLGLHDPDHYRYKMLAPDCNLYPQSLFLCILSMDRTLSLLLGLPPAAPSSQTVILNPAERIEPEYKFRVLCANIAARILDRNQLTEYDTSLEMTREIDRDLIKVTEQTPPEFWRPLSLAGLEPDSMNAFHEVQRAWDHMCYHYLAIQLHLRHILCPSKNSQYLYSRIACVNASREILSRQVAIRSSRVISASCRLGDFIALIAGMTLVLAHIVSHYHHEDITNVLVHQRISDRVIVEGGLKTLEAMSELREDLLGAKCSALLKDLLVVEAETAKYQAELRASAGATNANLERKMLTIQVPYMGTIRISAEGLSATPFTGNVREHELPEGVVVGGIGSLRVSDTNAPPVPGISWTCPKDAVQVPANEPPINIGQGEAFFPDASAPMDEWVFQGTDTAFFDSLLKGAHDQWLTEQSMVQNWESNNSF